MLFVAIIILDANSSGDLEVAEVPDIKVGLTRFICGVTMHIVANNEMVYGMKMMKYTVNHPWKFSEKRVAFLTGLLQVIAMLLITLSNYLVITIEDNILEIAKDFTALMIIAKFSDYFPA